MEHKSWKFLGRVHLGILAFFLTLTSALAIAANTAGVDVQQCARLLADQSALLARLSPQGECTEHQ